MRGCISMLKCAIKGCKEPAVYVLVDAYMFDKMTISRREIMVFPLCIDHDGAFHAFKKLYHAKSNRKLAKELKLVDKED